MEKLPFTMLSIKNFLFNPVLLACISSWFSAQFIKTVVNIIYGRIHSFSELFETLIWKTGGLPSSHSSLVTCLCTCVGFRNGPDSDVFLVALVFFLVTIRDAVGVRRSNGIQAKKLNEIEINGIRLYKMNNSNDIHLEFIWIDEQNPPKDYIQKIR